MATPFRHVYRRVQSILEEIHETMATSYKTNAKNEHSKFLVAKPIYGESLDEVAKSWIHPCVPFLVYVLCSEIERNFLHVSNLYCDKGDNNQVEYLIQLFRGYEFNPYMIKTRSVNVITSLLVKFIQDLNDPLIPLSFMDDIVFVAINEDNEARRVCRLREMIKRLPDNNYQTLKYLIRHLSIIAAHCHENTMSPEKLARLWGPILFINPVERREMSCLAMAKLIENYDFMFC